MQPRDQALSCHTPLVLHCTVMSCSKTLPLLGHVHCPPSFKLLSVVAFLLNLVTFPLLIVSIADPSWVVFEADFILLATRRRGVLGLRNICQDPDTFLARLDSGPLTCQTPSGAASTGTCCLPLEAERPGCNRAKPCMELQTILGTEVPDQTAAATTLGAIDATFSFIFASIIFTVAIFVVGIFAAGHCCGNRWIQRVIHVALLAASFFKALSTFIGTMSGLTVLTFMQEKGLVGLTSKAFPKAVATAEGGAALHIAVVCIFIDAAIFFFYAAAIPFEAAMPTPKLTCGGEGKMCEGKCENGCPSWLWSRPAESLFDTPCIGLGPEVNRYGEEGTELGSGNGGSGGGRRARNPGVPVRPRSVDRRAPAPKPKKVKAKKKPKKAAKKKPKKAKKGASSRSNPVAQAPRKPPPKPRY